MKYAFIKAHQAQFPTLRLCQALKVSRSGFYAWLDRPESQRTIFQRKLLIEIKQIHDHNHQRYGAVKCWKALKRKGIACGRDQIVRLRRANDIYSQRRRRFVLTTRSKQGREAAPNRLNRVFSVASPNKTWVGDVTFIPTRKGWLYSIVITTS